MLDKYLRPAVIQWLKTPHKPEVLPDAPLILPDAPTDTQGLLIAPSSTEESLVPSVLGAD